MNAPVKTPAEALPKWRLDDLYGGRHDPRIEADFAEAARISAELGALKGGFVAARASTAGTPRRRVRGAGLNAR